MNKKLIVIALFSILATGCKQGRGERCQVDADCADGLTCSQSQKICGGDDSEQFDAAPPDDAPATDAPAIDAP